MFRRQDQFQNNLLRITVDNGLQASKLQRYSAVNALFNATL